MILDTPLSRTTTTTAVTLEQVWKHYDSRPVVQNLSLQIAQGEMFGLLGPNGAGKSTTIRMLTTLTRPSQGSVTVGGFDVIRQSLQVRQLIGVVLQQITLDNDLTVWENLEFHGRMHHIPKPERQQRIDEWLSYVRLTDRRDSPVKTLSGGMKRRLQVARSLLHQPQILFLDEPTVGLDPQARRLLWDILRDLNQKGLTLLITTHYMEEAAELCHRVGIMDSGQLIALGSPQDLLQQYGEAIVIRVTPSQDPLADTNPVHFFPTLAEAQNYLDQLSDRTGTLIRASNLEDIFVQLTGRRLD